MHLSTVNETNLGAYKWREAIFLWYGLEPPVLPTHFYGYHAKFTIIHAFDCKRGGLVTERHNDLRDGVADLIGKSFTPSHVRDDPLICSVCAVKSTKATPAGAIGKNTRQVRCRRKLRSRRATY